MTRRQRVWAWLHAERRRGSVTLVLCVIVAAGTAYGSNIRANEAQTAATKKAAEISYRNAITLCDREYKPLANGVRANAKANQKVYRVLRGFLKGARPRALAQSKDPNISARSRHAARGSLKSIDDGINALSARLTIPPKPMPCDEVITDPNHSAAPHHH